MVSHVGICFGRKVLDGPNNVFGFGVEEGNGVERSYIGKGYEAEEEEELAGPLETGFGRKRLCGKKGFGVVTGVVGGFERSINISVLVVFRRGVMKAFFVRSHLRARPCFLKKGSNGSAEREGYHIYKKGKHVPEIKRKKSIEVGIVVEW